MTVKKKPFPDTDYVPLINAFRSIRNEGYKPTDVINKFWDKYKYEDAIAHIYETYLRMKGKKDNLHATPEQLDEYVIDVMELLVAYFFSHFDVFEKGEITVDMEKCLSYEPPTDPGEKILKSLFGFID